ncbi:MAG: phospholipase [Firmicutes bacterium]|nr:phospholipase [Bacillota bacterium]
MKLIRPGQASLKELLANNSGLAIGRILQVAGTPLQRLLDRAGGTHRFCNVQGIITLKNDGFRQYADILKRNFEQLTSGTYWADRGWRNASHHYNPFTNRGLWRWPSAVTECRRHLARSLDAWRAGRQDQSFFWLGAALHIVQDSCVPHHARAIITHGHQRYETWADSHKSDYAASGEGMYGLGEDPGKWVKSNALIAYSMYPKVSDGSCESDYRAASKVLLLRAQRTTAGFMAMFFELVDLISKADSHEGSDEGNENEVEGSLEVPLPTPAGL